MFGADVLEAVEAMEVIEGVRKGEVSIFSDRKVVSEVFGDIVGSGGLNGGLMTKRVREGRAFSIGRGRRVDQNGLASW